MNTILSIMFLGVIFLLLHGIYKIVVLVSEALKTPVNHDE